MHQTTPDTPPDDVVDTRAVLTLRVDSATLDRAAKLVPALSRPGAELTRAAVLRAALAAGLAALEAEVAHG